MNSSFASFILEGCVTSKRIFPILSKARVLIETVNGAPNPNQNKTDDKKFSQGKLCKYF